MKSEANAHLAGPAAEGHATANAARKVWSSPKVITGKMQYAEIGIDIFPDDADGDARSNNYS